MKTLSCAAIFFLFLAVTPVMGQSTRPAATSEASLESHALHLDPAATKAATSRQNGATPVTAASAFDLTRMVIALSVVIAVIFGLKALARKLAITPGTSRTGLVRLVARTSLSPRQHVMLLQVGKRVIVVGDSAGAMAPLAEITDPDEVAALVGAGLSQEKASPVVSFGSLFRKASEPFDEPTEPVAGASEDPSPRIGNIEPVNADLGSEMGGLIDKVRFLKQRFG